jgi:CRISPR-associated protein Cas5h
MALELLSFDVCGKFAHFRKFYANSTALSYSLPPRTTILGMIAAILGLPRDSYYTDEVHSLEHLLIGVEIVNPFRKSFHTMNHLKIDTKSIDDFTGVGNYRSQTPMELLTPPNLRSGHLCFRIYVGTTLEQDNQFTELKERVQAGNFPFGISLGTVNMLGWVDNVRTNINASLAIIHQGEPVALSSAILVEYVKKVEYETNSLSVQIEQDQIPLSLKINAEKNALVKTRIAHRVAAMIYTLGGQSLRVQLRPETSHIYKITPSHLPEPIFIALT